jgi:hypothetical protein
MSLPKQVKNKLSLIPQKFGVERRQELLEDITDKGTYLPKGVLHADLDRGMLDFVKDQLELSVDGKKIPTIDRIITNQSWIQFTETWDFQDLDNNVSLPFISTVRMPEVKYGTNNAGRANIPVRRQFFYYSVPTWDGQRKGVDVYKIPQPIPVDLTFNVKIFCNRMREVNEFNRIMMRTFTSKQAYCQIKGHYIPLKLEDVTDESVKDISKRKYYISTYKITMLGLLIDEEEFEVTPGITRQVSLFEFDTRTPSKRAVIEPPNPKDFTLDFLYVTGNTSLTEVFRYTANIDIIRTENLKTCFYLGYTSTTTNTLGYVSCVGTPTTIPLTTGSTGNVCVKGGTTPTLSNVTGGTLSSSSSCFGSYSVNITRDGVSYYLGDDISPIQIINGDTLNVVVNKLDPTQQSIIYTNVTLV